MIKIDYWLFWLLGLLWGTNFLFMKMAVQIITPLQAAWLRVIFGFLPILIFALTRHALKFQHLRHSGHFIVMGVLAVVVPYIGFIKGTQLLASGSAGAISGIIPLVTALFAALFLPTDRLTPKKCLGLGLGFLGVAMIAHLEHILDYSAHDAILGAGFMILGSLGYASAMIYTRKYITPLKLGSLPLACYQSAAAALILSLFVPLHGVEVIFVHPKALAALIIGLGLLGTGVAFVIYYRIIEKLGAVVASSVFYIPPMVALAVGGLIANEEIGLTQYLGVTMIVLGIFLTRNGD